jgi:phage terminase small subunit
MVELGWGPERPPPSLLQSKRGRDGLLPKLSKKQAGFVREYMIDRNAAAAYKRAGYAGDPKQGGPELLRRPAVRLAVDEETARHARRCEVSLDTVTLDLREDRALAHSEGQASAAVAATVALAKLHGLMVDRSESKVDAHTTVDVQVRVEQVRAEVKEIFEHARRKLLAGRERVAGDVGGVREVLRGDVGRSVVPWPGGRGRGAADAGAERPVLSVDASVEAPGPDAPVDVGAGSGGSGAA